MGNPASQSRWILSSPSQGNKRLRRVQSASVSSEGSRQVVTAQGEDKPIGITKTIGGVTISLQVYEEQGTPEVDWRHMNRTDEWFTLTREIVGGKRFQYVDCQVSKVDPSDDDSHMIDVEIIALEEKPL